MDFRTHIGAVWTHLGLPAPAFESDGRIVLTVDGLAVVLSESPDGRQVIVAAQVGGLSAQQHLAADQVTALLYLSLNACADHRACLRLDQSESAGPKIVVEAVQPIHGHSPPDMAALIEDMLELHRRAAEALSQPAGRSLPASSAGWDRHDVILHP